MLGSQQSHRANDACSVIDDHSDARCRANVTGTKVGGFNSEKITARKQEVQDNKDLPLNAHDPGAVSAADAASTAHHTLEAPKVDNATTRPQPDNETTGSTRPTAQQAQHAQSLPPLNVFGAPMLDPSTMMSMADVSAAYGSVFAQHVPSMSTSGFPLLPWTMPPPSNHDPDTNGLYLPTQSYVDSSDPRLVWVNGLDLNVVDDKMVLRVFQEHVGAVRCVGVCMSGAYGDPNGGDGGYDASGLGVAWVLMRELEDAVKAPQLHGSSIGGCTVSVYLPNLSEATVQALARHEVQHHGHYQHEETYGYFGRGYGADSMISLVSPKRSESSHGSTFRFNDVRDTLNATASNAPSHSSWRGNEVRKLPDGCFEMDCTEASWEFGDLFAHIKATRRHHLMRGAVTSMRECDFVVKFVPESDSFQYTVTTCDEATVKCMIHYLLVVKRLKSPPPTPMGPVSSLRVRGTSGGISIPPRTTKGSSLSSTPTTMSAVSTPGSLSPLPTELSMDASAPDASDKAAFAMFKTRLCNSWMRYEQQRRLSGAALDAKAFQCPRGPTCPYAHGNDELRRNPLFKTRICELYWMTGECKYTMKSRGGCHFAHGLDELRAEDADMTALHGDTADDE